MHKLLLTSAAYQQSSQPSAEALTRDPENKLFSRQNRVRLEGEVLRDSLLAISGRLNREMRGSSVSPPIPSDIVATAKNWTTSPREADHHRRSIYVFARRNLRFPFLEVFDAPDSNLSCPERSRSTTAPQSLTLLNSEEVMAAARETADRVHTQVHSAEDRVDFVFRLILGRHPSAHEATLSREFLKSSSQRQSARTSTGNREWMKDDQSRLTSAATMGEWQELCRALFNLNAFVYAE